MFKINNFFKMYGYTEHTNALADITYDNYFLYILILKG